MRLFCCIVLSLIFSFGLQAQNKTKTKDKIVLKNGSLLVGDIQEYELGEYIIIEIKGNNVRINDSDIKKVFMDDNNQQKSTFRIDRLYNRTNFGLLTNANGIGASINHTVSYAFSRWIAVGAGLGIDNYYLSEGRNVYPIFLEMKTYLIDNNSSPFVSLKGGYGVIFTNEKLGQTATKGGAFFNPYFGYRFGTRGLFVDIYGGLRFQQSVYEYQNGSTQGRQDITWKRIEFGLGLNF